MSFLPLPGLSWLHALGQLLVGSIWGLTMWPGLEVLAWIVQALPAQGPHATLADYFTQQWGQGQQQQQNCRTGLGALQQHLTSTLKLAASTPDDLAALKRPDVRHATAQHWAAQWYHNLAAAATPAAAAPGRRRSGSQSAAFMSLVPAFPSSPQPPASLRRNRTVHLPLHSHTLLPPPSPMRPLLCWLPVDFKCNRLID